MLLFLFQKRNRLVNWGFNTMEGVVLATAEAFQPAVKLFNGPISMVDRVICRSIDFVETKIPSIYLPPEMVYPFNLIIRPKCRDVSSFRSNIFRCIRTLKNTWPIVLCAQY